MENTGGNTRGSLSHDDAECDETAAEVDSYLRAGTSLSVASTPKTGPTQNYAQRRRAHAVQGLDIGRLEDRMIAQEARLEEAGTRGTKRRKGNECRNSA